MTAFTHLTSHLKAYAYTKGDFKGDAPLDPSRRWATHLRVLATSTTDTLAVRMHQTDIITAHPDGTVTLDTDGWYAHPTTRKAVSVAMRLAGFQGQSLRTMGNRQYSLLGEVYYDGMVFGSDGVLLSPPRPFMVRRINRELSLPFYRALKASSTRDTFAVLLATATHGGYYNISSSDLANTLTDPRDADLWPMIAAHFAKRGGWPGILAHAKAHMYHDVPAPL